MAPWKPSLLIVALGLLGAGCADNQDNTPHQSHHTARASVTGSNIPQAAAYGDGVNDTATRSSLNSMGQQSQTSMGGGLSGGSVGGAR